MTDSMITRCPKCSTAFRVGADILSMAKGKVRCGQCFHIFEAKPLEDKKNVPSKTESAPAKHTPTESTSESRVEPVKKYSEEIKQSTTTQHSIDEDNLVNPEWLHTLFDDDDLSPIDKYNNDANLNTASKKVIEKNQLDNEQSDDFSNSYNDELAPWEREFAELEPNTNAWEKKEPTIKENTTPSAKKHLPPTKIYDESIKDLISSKPKNTEKSSNSQASNFKSYTEGHQEPDYMKALHTLAQHSSVAPSKEQALERLAPLINNDSDVPDKKYHTLWWLLGVLIFTFTLLLQTANHFFEYGSRSAQFRPLYKVFCTYTGCTLPNFEDISAINIQHVRIQSHPSQVNALLVNAIMTNTSRYSQAMPKIALEFYDLNGAPVAARLFSPNNFLHKDFLDITYMPPNTPIHIVIPIYDPGAQAVTHRLKVYPSSTESY